MKKYRLELGLQGDIRDIEADRYEITGGWVIFYRQPPQGGSMREHWRVQENMVLSIYTS
jgi:hypothetical protein